MIDKLTAAEQKRKIQKLVTLCVQNGIEGQDLFDLIRRRKSIEDFKWTS